MVMSEGVSSGREGRPSLGEHTGAVGNVLMLLALKGLLTSSLWCPGILTLWSSPLPQGVQKAMHVMPQRFRIFRSPMGTFVGAFLSLCTWSSPDCSHARHWRPLTSKWVSSPCPACRAHSIQPLVTPLCKKLRMWDTTAY